MWKITFSLQAFISFAKVETVSLRFCVKFEHKSFQQITWIAFYLILVDIPIFKIEAFLLLFSNFRTLLSSRLIGQVT